MKPTGYPAPSAKRLIDALHITPEQATTVRALIRGEIKIQDNPLFPITAKWINSCHHPLPRIDRILGALNECLGMHGVECITSGGQHMDGSHVVAEYLNAGDTYNATLLFNHRTQAFSLTTWGDFVERNQARYSIA